MRSISRKSETLVSDLASLALVAISNTEVFSRLGRMKGRSIWTNAHHLAGGTHPSKNKQAPDRFFPYNSFSSTSTICVVSMPIFVEGSKFQAKFFHWTTFYSKKRLLNLPEAPWTRTPAQLVRLVYKVGIWSYSKIPGRTCFMLLIAGYCQ